MSTERERETGDPAATFTPSMNRPQSFFSLFIFFQRFSDCLSAAAFFVSLFIGSPYVDRPMSLNEFLKKIEVQMWRVFFLQKKKRRFEFFKKIFKKKSRSFCQQGGGEGGGRGGR